MQIVAPHMERSNLGSEPLSEKSFWLEPSEYVGPPPHQSKFANDPRLFSSGFGERRGERPPSPPMLKILWGCETHVVSAK